MQSTEPSTAPSMPQNANRGSAHELAPQFLRLPAVIHLTGLGRSTIYRLIAAREFPCPVKLASRAVAWRRTDLDHWGETRPSSTAG